jgi:hypothetical protein
VVRVLDHTQAEKLEALCEAIVPGSARVGPAVYLDAALARMPPPVRERTPEFALVRALAIEAFYSDFVAPGLDADGAWAEIDFAPPAAQRLRKDWSYLGIA